MKLVRAVSWPVGVISKRLLVGELVSFLGLRRRGGVDVIGGLPEGVVGAARGVG